jgi:translation initiation factor 2 subunit 2
MSTYNSGFSQDFLLDLPTKKKKKPQNRFLNLDSNEKNTILSGSSYTSDNINDTYTYQYLLSRALTNLKKDVPQLTGTPIKVKLQPLDVQKEGIRKTIVTNFMQFCKQVNREHTHVMAFILAELCVIGSLDGTLRLVLRGRFNSSSIESIARKYINEYVICNACKNIDTLLHKEPINRLLVLTCETCLASRTLQHITQGFRAKV